SSSTTTLIKLLHINPNDFPTTESYAAEMCDLVANLKDLNLSITKTSVMGLLLHINLKDGPFEQEFAQQVEHIICWLSGDNKSNILPSHIKHHLSKKYLLLSIRSQPIIFHLTHQNPAHPTLEIIQPL
ncbi:uncharacterized protein VP01_1966g2, partial [Puccinia sorghi]